MLFEKNILQLLHKKYLHQQPEAQNVIRTLEDRNERWPLKTCSIMLQKTGRRTHWKQYSAGLSPLHPPTY